MRDLLRPWRDGAFRVLALAMFVAALALASVVLLRAELEDRFAVRTAEVLGGQLVLHGSSAPTEQQRQWAATVDSTETVDFATVVLNDDEMLLVAARAVADEYPLLGQLQVADDRFATGHSRPAGPPAGEAWVADQALDRLDLRINDEINIGRKTLPITAIVRQEPDQGAGFYSVNPRVMFHLSDLDATGVLGPGTRVDYRLLMVGADSEIRQLEQQLRDSLRPDQRIETLAEAAVRSMGPLRQLTLWVSLGVLLVSLLCGAAIYLATSQRVRRRARLSALLRSFGASRRQVLQRMLISEFIAVLPPAALGTGAGIGLILLLRQALGWQGPLAAGTVDWLVILVGPLLLWFAFGLPRLTALVRVPAMQVLNAKNDSQHLSTTVELAGALAAPVLLAALLTGTLRDLGQILILLVVLAVLLPALLWPLLKMLDASSRGLPLAARIAVRRLSRRPTLTLPLLAALTIAMAVLAMAGQTGNQLLADWRTKLPEQAPNFFIFNLFEEDIDRLDAWIERHEALGQPAYPVVRGRLTEINEQPVREAVSKHDDRAERTLNRDLVLTEAERLPASNSLAAGRWFGEHDGAEVSVEQEIATSLQLEIGDKVQFVTSRDTVEATITSIREVDWDSFAPNFFFMFSPDGLAGQDITWLTSFWLADGDGARLAELMREMPHITLLDVNAILDQAQDIVRQASRATALLAALLMAAALLVLLAALMGGQDRRARDNALLRALGARKQLVLKVEWYEFLTLGLGAAAGASLILLAALYPLGQRLFSGDLPWSLWLLLPAALGLLVAAAGVAVGNRTRRTPPMVLLKQD